MHSFLIEFYLEWFFFMPTLSSELTQNHGLLQNQGRGSFVLGLPTLYGRNSSLCHRHQLSSILVDTPTGICVCSLGVGNLQHTVYPST